MPKKSSVTLARRQDEMKLRLQRAANKPSPNVLDADHRARISEALKEHWVERKRRKRQRQKELIAWLDARRRKFDSERASRRSATH